MQLTDVLIQQDQQKLIDLVKLWVRAVVKSELIDDQDDAYLRSGEMFPQVMKVLQLYYQQTETELGLAKDRQEHRRIPYITRRLQCITTRITEIKPLMQPPVTTRKDDVEELMRMLEEAVCLSGDAVHFVFDLSKTHPLWRVTKNTCFEMGARFRDLNIRFKEVKERY